MPTVVTNNIFVKLTSLFASQEKVFSEYLIVLKLEEKALASQASDKLPVYAELGTDLVNKLTAIQKVIFPFERLWAEQNADFTAHQTLVTQKTRLALLKDQVKAGIESNKQLLIGQLAMIKKELSQLAVSNSRHTSYPRVELPSFIDITG